jgi:hypothetical protein
MKAIQTNTPENEDTGEFAAFDNAGLDALAAYVYHKHGEEMLRELFKPILDWDSAYSLSALGLITALAGPGGFPDYQLHKWPMANVRVCAKLCQCVPNCASGTITRPARIVTARRSRH